MTIKNIRTYFQKGASSMLLFFILASATHGQTVKPDTVQYAFLPALAYNSDLGFIGGGLASRYAFQDGVRPFYSYIHANVIISTKGLLSSRVIYDKPRAFQSDYRVTTDAFIAKFLQNQYYGIGNYAKLPDAPAGNPDFYQYQSFSAGIEILVRKPLLMIHGDIPLDIFGLVDAQFLTPFENDTNLLISIMDPYGNKGTHTAALGTGFILDNRDSEFLPTRGMYSQVGIESGLEIWGSASDYYKIESEFSTYTTFHLLKDITFANRLSYQHSGGKLPFWKLPELGGEESMRGYPEHRFIDDNAIFLNSELRTWLFAFPQYNVRFGGTLFMDIGRTYPSGTPLDQIAKDLKYTFGFGTTSSFFNENFIMRGDFGFSDEGMGIYFTAGYMF